MTVVAEMSDEMEEQETEQDLTYLTAWSEATFEELSEQIALLEKERDDNRDRMLRAIADLDNAKKRFHKEKSDIKKYGNETLLLEMLTVVDNLERATSQESSDETLSNGIQMILLQTKKILSDFGASEFNSVGTKFDPMYHEAVQREPSEEHPPMTVIRELETGYTYKDKLLRPAKVVVSVTARKPEPEPEEVFDNDVMTAEEWAEEQKAREDRLQKALDAAAQRREESKSRPRPVIQVSPKKTADGWRGRIADVRRNSAADSTDVEFFGPEGIARYPENDKIQLKKSALRLVASERKPFDKIQIKAFYQSAFRRPYRMMLRLIRGEDFEELECFLSNFEVKSYRRSSGHMTKEA